MLPTVPETTRNSSEIGSIFCVLSSLGGSLAGSGALAALAVCCLLFATGMNTSELAAGRAAPAAAEASESVRPSLPEVKQIRWIKNIVDEPMQMRRATHGVFGDVSPLGVELPLVAC